MVTLGRIKNNDISVIGELNERLPSVTQGLVAHFPFDGRGGAFSAISGHSTKENLETGVNLIEALSIDWRDSSAWTSDITTTSVGIQYDASKDALKLTGYRAIWLKTPIVIETNKKYQISVDVFIETRSSDKPLTYIGGNLLNANGTKVTQNYDYTLASAWNPTKGIWHTLKLTRTGTASMTNIVSTSFDTVTGWKGGGSASDPIARFYHFGGLFNYQDDTGVTYIRNLKIEVVSDDTSYTVLNDEGLYIDLPSKNLDTAINSMYTVYNNHLNPATQEDTGETMMGTSIYKVRFTPNNATQLESIKKELWGQGVYSPHHTFKANTKYACSIYWKPLTHHNMEFGGHASNKGGFYIGYNEYIGDGWYRYHRYRDGTTGEVSDAIHHSFRISDAKLNEPIEFLYACPQIEEGITSPSAYMKPAQPRTKRSLVTLNDNIINWNAGTINIKFKPNRQTFIDSAGTGESGFNRIWSILKSATNNDIADGMTVTINPSGIYVEAVSPIKTRYQTGAGTIPAPELNKWIDITVRWKKTAVQFEFDISALGKTAYKTAPLTDCPTQPGIFKIGDLLEYNRLCSGIYKDLSIYNRYLTDSEVSTLQKPNPISISTSGNLLVESFTEKIIETDNDTYHFPLMTDTNEVRGRVSAAKEENLVYTQEGVFVGKQEVINYAQYPISAYDKYYTHIRDGDNQIFVRHTGSTSPSLFFTIDTLVNSMVSGDKYTVSGYLYINGKPAKFEGDGVNRHRTPSQSTRLSNGYFSSTQIYNPSDGGAQWVVGRGFDREVNIGDIVEIKHLQVTKGAIVVPYSPQKSSSGLLAFSLNKDLRWDWNGSWSIVYWKKPISTRTSYDFTDYSIDSLGSVPSTVGAGYLWWGKDVNSNVIFASTPTNITPEKYFNNWRMISLVKSGNNIKINEIDYFGNVYVRNATADYTAANQFVSNDGFDLRLGHYFNSTVHKHDSCFRDLIVSKRAFTDAELTTLFKKQMSVNKNGITIPGILKEGQIH